MHKGALPSITAGIVLLLAGCATSSSSDSSESGRTEPEAPAPKESTRGTESRSAAEEAAPRRETRDSARRSSAAETRSEPVTSTERAATRSALAAAGTGGTSDISRLVEQLREAARELATLRAANARLKVERERAEKTAQSAAESEESRRAREKTAAELKAASEELRKLKETVERLGEYLSVERRLRLEAENTTAQLRDELKTIARAVGELATSPRAEDDRRRSRD
ncbi:MAG: hypothetical protein ACKODK_20045 [Opitutaceae bacterium]